MFDYIIVGAGSAGCVMANRLSADPAKRVCLIEAGPPDRNPMIHMPFGLALLARTGWANWAYDTAPEGQLNNRRLYWPRGKTLGGSSSINAMIYMRGHPDDYEGWAAAAGPEWGWSHLAPLFRALEGNVDLADAHHGTTGPLTVSNLRHVNPMSRLFVAAAVQAGHAENPDFNGATQEGVGLYQVTQRDGQRFSAARAFLDPIRHRPNLVIDTGALVERVLFDGTQAVGLRVAGRDLRLRDGGEVILCAGAVNSPQLLMLSGIGPAAELARHGIPVRVDAPEVGENLADHLDICLLARTRTKQPIGIAPGLLPRALRALWSYARSGRGEFTSNVAEAGGFAKSDPTRPRPNLQFHFLPALLGDHGRKTILGYGVTLHVCDLLPKSRGRITLNSADPKAPARIEANYLSHPEDRAVLLQALKMARGIFAAPALAEHIRAEILPGPDVQSDAALMDHIRAQAETIYHPVGSCRMGRDARAVVAPDARVRGVSGLRVVDASVMPSIIAGNTNAPTMVIAENVARMMTAQG